MQISTCQEKFYITSYRIKIFKFISICFLRLLNLKEKRKFIALAAFCGETFIVKYLYAKSTTITFVQWIFNFRSIIYYALTLTFWLNSTDKLFIHEFDSVCNFPTILLKQSRCICAWIFCSVPCAQRVINRQTITRRE